MKCRIFDFIYKASKKKYKTLSKSLMEEISFYPAWLELLFAFRDIPK